MSGALGQCVKDGWPVLGFTADAAISSRGVATTADDDEEHGTTLTAGVAVADGATGTERGYAPGARSSSSYSSPSSSSPPSAAEWEML